MSLAESREGASRAGSVRPGSRLWPDLLASLRNPEFWAFSSWLDLLVRARKSHMGLFWLLVPAIVYVFGLGSFLAGMQGRTVGAFAAHLALGAMVFRSLMSTVVGSAGVFNSSQSFIMDGQTRMTDYVLQSLAKSFFDFCTYIPVAAVALTMSGAWAWQGLLWAPAALLLIYLNAFWMSTVFALGGARFPDLGQVTHNTSIFLFLLTPIIWYPEMMPADSARGQLMRFNPFYHMVTLFRAPIMGERIEPATYWYIGVMTVAGLALATVLYRRYTRYVPLWI